MYLPQPLVIRRSRSNFTYLFNMALCLGFLGYGYALADQWPSVASWKPEGDYLVAGMMFLAGTLTFVMSIIRPLLDRAPLMVIDEKGISPAETGGLFVPWREISDYRFEKIQEGRNAYWYFFFTQTDAATGAVFDYKISADEFDCSNDEVTDLVSGYKAADRKTIPITKQRPASIVAGSEGEMLSVGYSRAKEFRSLALYWGILVIVLAFATYVGLVANFGTASLMLFITDPVGVLSVAETWLKIFWGAAFSLVLLATAFRVRDLLFRTVALRADRKGLTCADIGAERVMWSDISAIRIEPYGTLHLTVNGGHAQGERFVNILRLALSQQEIFYAMVWLLAHFKIKFSQP